jgi:hypothetical protein
MRPVVNGEPGWANYVNIGPPVCRYLRMTRFKYLKDEEASGEPEGPAVKLTIKTIKGKGYLYAQGRVGNKVRSVCLASLSELLEFIKALQRKLDCGGEEAFQIAVLYYTNEVKKEQMNRAFVEE